MKKNDRRKSKKDYYKEISSWDDEDLEGEVLVDGEDDSDSDYADDNRIVYSSDAIEIDETEEDEEIEADGYVLYASDLVESSKRRKNKLEDEEVEDPEDEESEEDDIEDSEDEDSEEAEPDEGSEDKDSDEYDSDSDDEDSEEYDPDEDSEEYDPDEDDDDDDDDDDSDEDDDEDDVDDDEDDDEYDEDDDEEYEDEATYLRRIRHKRRIRNQIISYIIVLILLAALGFGIYCGASKILALYKNYKAQAAIEKQQEEEAQAEEEAAQEESVIETPEVEIEEEETAEEEEIVEEEDILEVALTKTISDTISDMTLEEKVAQLFFITPGALTDTDAPTQAGETTRNRLTEYPVGGLIYDTRNIADETKLTEMLSNTVTMSKNELFFAIREPGGEKSSVYGSSLTNIPQVDDPATIAANGDSSQAYNAGATIASYLSGYGFNLNISPDGSIVSSEDMINKELAYGSEAAVSYDMISKMVEGLKSGGVNSCLTNFPGNGNITEDTAKGRVGSEATNDDLDAQTVAYDCGFAAGAELVMLNNVTYTVADESGMPASLSKYIIGTLLRGNMGYDGIVVTGPLNDAAITEYYTSEEAALYAIAAGADMLYMPEDFVAAYEGVLAAVKDGTIPESRIDESLARILRVKFEDDPEWN